MDANRFLILVDELLYRYQSTLQTRCVVTTPLRVSSVEVLDKLSIYAYDIFVMVNNIKAV